MKLIGAVFLLIVFVLPVHAQDLFDRAEIEFDIDYIDIDKVKVMGGTKKGQVMAVWMKSGSVLTKTLSKSKIKYNDSNNNSYSYSYSDGDNEVYNYESDESVPQLKLKEMSTDEIITMANEIINKSEWTYNYKFSTSFAEELNLCSIISHFGFAGKKGAEYVQLTMDIITAEIEHGQRASRLLLEKSNLLDFAEGDDQLTKMANDFLEENGFNKEK